MSTRITIPWLVDDGYDGGRRPHSSTFSAKSFDLDATDEELADEIAEAVQEQFSQSVTLSLKTEDVIAAVKAIRAAAALSD